MSGHVVWMRMGVLSALPAGQVPTGVKAITPYLFNARAWQKDLNPLNPNPVYFVDQAH